MGPFEADVGLLAFKGFSTSPLFQHHTLPRSLYFPFQILMIVEYSYYIAFATIVYQSHYLQAFLFIFPHLMMVTSSFLSNQKHEICLSPFVTLPIELKARIISFLPALDVTNLRLICRAFAGVCVEGMFNVVSGGFIQSGTFSIRPHIVDMTRLQHICNRPWLARMIRHVNIYVGDVDMVEFDQEVQAINKVTERECVWKSERRINRLLDQIIGNRNQHCDPVILSRAFSLLPMVESISATSTRCPFSASETTFCAAWERMLLRWNLEPGSFFDAQDPSMPSLSGIKYLSILLPAARRVKRPVRKLILDTLPIDLFIRHDPQDINSYEMLVHTDFIREIQNMTSQVQDLHLGFTRLGDRIMYQRPALAQAIGGFLGSMSYLRSLDFTWNMSWRYDNDLFEGEWQTSFYNNTWPHLKKLRLSKVRSPELLFSSFIGRHKALKFLSLGHDFFITSQEDEGECVSYKKLLTSFRKTLHLEKFQLMVSAHDAKIWDDDWERVPSNNALPDAELFEMFVLGRCVWPMENLESKYPDWKKLDEWRGWKRIEQFRDVNNVDDIKMKLVPLSLLRTEFLSRK